MRSVKSEKKNKNKKRGNADKVRFNWLMNILLMPICFLIRPFLRARSEMTPEFRAQRKRGASLVICNHVSAFDFLMFTTPFSGKKINFVVAENMQYSHPLFSSVINGYHCILKKQFYADFQCIKNIKRYLDAGISVVLCPEGKVSADGKTGIVPPSIGRLVKWLGYPVTTIITEGAGIMRPKWAHTLRFGKVVAKCDLLYSAEDIAKLDKDEIYGGIMRRLDYNEHKQQVEKGVFFRGKRYAEGLERVLYRCPKCGAEFMNETKGDTMTCLSCGNSVMYSHTGEILPVGADSVALDRIDLWSDFEREEVAAEVLSEDFYMEHTVSLFTENEKKNGYKFIADGRLSINREEMRFFTENSERPKNVYATSGVQDMRVGEMPYGETEPIEDEFKDVRFKIKHLTTIASIPGLSVDLYDDKHSYRLMFTDVKASTKYAFAVEEAAKLREKGQIQ